MGLEVMRLPDAMDRVCDTPTVVEVDLEARTLRAEVPSLGFGALGAEASSARATREAQAPPEFIDVRAIECQLLLESLTDAILRARAFVGEFPPDLATPLILEYRTALQRCGSSEGFDGVAALLRETACERAAAATLQARAILSETIDEVERSVRVLVAAEGLVQVVGADCGIDVEDFESEIQEFARGYLGRIEDPAFTASFLTWDALWNELRVCFRLSALGALLGATQAETLILEELFPALFARLREVALSACEEDANNALLADLLSGGHLLDHPIAPEPGIPLFTGIPEAALVEDLQRCGSSLRLVARDFDGQAVGVPLAVQSKLAPGGSIVVPRDGRLVVESEILSIRCGQALSRAPIRVRAEVPGSLPVVSLGTLDGSLGVSIAAATAALPGGAPAGFDLVVERDRAPCNLPVANVPAVELFRVSVKPINAFGAGSGGFSGSVRVPAGAGFQSVAVSGTFTLEIAGSGAGG